MKTIFILLCISILNAFSQIIRPQYYVEPISKLENHLGTNGQYMFGFDSSLSSRDEIQGSDGITEDYYAFKAKNAFETARANAVRSLNLKETEDRYQRHDDINDDNAVGSLEVVHPKLNVHLYPRVPQQFEDINILRSKVDQKKHTYIRNRKILTTTQAPLIVYQQKANTQNIVQYQTTQIPYPTYHNILSGVPVMDPNEPCHGPLCNVKYKELQRQIVLQPGRVSDYVPPPKYKNQGQFLKENIHLNGNDYRVQVQRSDDFEKYKATLLAAENAYKTLLGQN